MKQLVVRVVKFCLICIMALDFSGECVAQPCVIQSMNISPAMPTPSDTIHFRVAVWFSAGGPSGDTLLAWHMNTDSNDFELCAFYNVGVTAAPQTEVDSFVITPQAPGDYSIIYKVNHFFFYPDCDTIVIAQDTCFFTVSAINALTYNNENRAELFPNPFTNHITIKGLKHEIDYTLTNLHGQLIQQGKTEGELEIQNELPYGMYFLQIDNMAYKVLKE